VEITTRTPVSPPDTPFGRTGREADMTSERWRGVCAAAATWEDLPVMVGGFGDPLEHPRFADFLAEARAAGVAALGVATFGLGLDAAACRAIVEAEGLAQISGDDAIRALAQQVIAENPEQVAQYKAKPTLLKWFVGQVMRKSQGKANAQLAEKILVELLQ